MVGGSGLLTGLRLTGTFGPRYTFAMPGLCNPSVGSIGFLVRAMALPTAPAASLKFVGLYGVGSFNWIEVTAETDGFVYLEHSENTGQTNTDIFTQTNVLTEVGAQYGIVARWDAGNSRRSLEIYSKSGALLHNYTETTKFSQYVPTELNDEMWIGGGDIGTYNSDVHLDNVFVSDAYDEPIQENFRITSFTEYDAARRRRILMGRAA